MTVKMEQDPSCEDIEVTVRYDRESDLLRRIVELLRRADLQIVCGDGGAERLVNAADIFYIESVDKRTFVCLEKEVYHTSHRLYQMAEQLKPYGFVQVSKSCIINIHQMESIRPIFNSRMEATLKNGERIYVNRNYLGDVKRALKGADRK